MVKVKKDKDRPLLNANRRNMEVPMSLFPLNKLIKENKKVLRILAKRGF